MYSVPLFTLCFLMELTLVYVFCDIYPEPLTNLINGISKFLFGMEVV
jgi:hypothetical protein